MPRKQHESASEIKPPDANEVARRLAEALESEGCEYALGGAIALGFWGAPRGTVDVDVTLFLSPDEPSSCVRLWQQIGCTIDASAAIASLQALSG